MTVRVVKISRADHASNTLILRLDHEIVRYLAAEQFVNELIGGEEIPLLDDVFGGELWTFLDEQEPGSKLLLEIAEMEETEVADLEEFDGF